MPRGSISDEDKELVLSQLKGGKANSISARNIANAVNLRSDRTDVRIRTVISELIEDGQAIGSWDGGYYLIDTEAELEETFEGIRVRVRGMQQRLDAIARNYAARKRSQEGL